MAADIKELVHPLVVRVTHWINVVALLLMVASGWRIYNADPIFDFSFPDDLSVYNAAQRAAYLALIIALIVMVLSGLAIWKPVQLYWLASLMGDYEGARLLHFFAMAAVVLIVIVHVIMVILVPRTFPTMFTGRIRRAS